MLSRVENDTLTRTGPGTPMGKLLRQYWMPAFLSEELESGGEPIAIQLLGQRLVGFRRPDGRVGILDEFCPHRRVSLAYARNEPEGLRCIYHGWQVNCEGRVVDTPAEPQDSTFKEKIRQPAYAVQEAGGLVWVYLGELPAPPFVRWPWVKADPASLDLTKILEECNWLQGLEGSIDSAHSDFLHSAQIAGRPQDHAPRLEMEDTAYGFRYAAIRRPDADPERSQYVRVTLFRYPNHVFIPPQRWGGQDVVTHHLWVPVDDEHNYFFSIRYNRSGSIRQGHRRSFEMDEQFRPRRNRANKHLQDRRLMASGHWSGIDAGVNSEDLAVIESGEPIFDRSQEHLGASDAAVSHMRRLLLRAARSVNEGGSAPARDVPEHSWQAEERIIPREWPWQQVSVIGDPAEQE